jgi:magnesium transporter
MSSAFDTASFLSELREALARGRMEALVPRLEELRTQHLLDLWGELEPTEKDSTFRLISADKAAELVTHLPEDEQPGLLTALPSPQLASLLHRLSPDDLADTLQGLEAHDPDQIAAVKSLLVPETLAVADTLAGYHEEEAGGLITPEFVSVRGSMTASQVLEFLRRAHPDAETIYYLYVVDVEDRLSGVLSLRDLIVSAPSSRIQDIMHHDVVKVSTDTDQEDVARLMADYDFPVLPVVDPERRLVGIVTVDDVIDVLEEEATEDIHRLGGAPIDIDYVRAGPWLLFRKRASWLALLVVSMTLTFNVITYYDAIIQEVVILAAFIPFLIGTGGNVGSQVATLVVRALATRELELRDYSKVLVKEIGTGLLLGGAFGLFMTLYVLFFRADPRIAVALGITMVCISLTANLVGASLPFLFRRFGIDPALTSSPALTTIMDVVGLLIYFRVVIWILGPVLTSAATGAPPP